MLECYLMIVAIALSLTSDLARAASLMQLAVVYWCFWRASCWEITRGREDGGAVGGEQAIYGVKLNRGGWLTRWQYSIITIAYLRRCSSFSMVNMFVSSTGDQSQIMTKLDLMRDQMTQTGRKKCPEVPFTTTNDLIWNSLINSSASIANASFNFKMISRFSSAVPFLEPCAGPNRAGSLQPADSISVALSAVTCACADSESCYTHRWICSGPEFSPGFHGRTVNRLIITSACLRIEVAGRDFTVPLTTINQYFRICVYRKSWGWSPGL